MLASRLRTENEAYKPRNTINLVINKNGLVSLDENMMFTERRTGYKEINTDKIEDIGKEIEKSTILHQKYFYWRDKCKFGIEEKNKYLELKSQIYKYYEDLKAKSNKPKFVLTPKYYNGVTKKIVNIDGWKIEDFLSGETTIREIKTIEKEYILKNGTPTEKYKINKNIMDSVARTSKLLRRYCFNNPWKYFVTITVNSEKCDRYSFRECVKNMTSNFRVLKQRIKRKCETLEADFQFDYLVVPETHKDGAYHFHGFINLIAPDNIIAEEFQKVNGHMNIMQFYNNMGFSEIDKIRDMKKSSKYVSKYISKQIHDKNSIRNKIPFAQLLIHSQKLNTSMRLEIETIPEEYADEPYTVDTETGEYKEMKYRFIMGDISTEESINEFLNKIENQYSKFIEAGGDLVERIKEHIEYFKRQSYFEVNKSCNAY